MEFPMVDEKEGRYAHVFPVGTDGNEDLRKVAQEAGDVKMVGWRGKGEDARWRLFEDRIPEGVVPEEKFAKFITPEAEQGFIAERTAKLEATKKVEKVMPVAEEIPSEKLYYPVTGKERDAFNALKKDLKDKGTPVDMPYNDKVGAFVHKSGPTEGFERWQTPEAKAEWEARGATKSKAQDKIVDRAREVGEPGGIVDKAGQGKTFLAEHANGLKLPSSAKYPAEHERMMAGIKAASNEDLAKVFATTEARFKGLERKLYGMQLSGAEKKGVSKDDFNAMDSRGRREASGYTDLTPAEFAEMTALKNGFFKLNAERKERGVYKSVEEARALKEGASVGQQGGEPKAADEQKKTVAPETPAKDQPQGRSKSRGPSHAAELASALGR